MRSLFVTVLVGILVFGLTGCAAPPRKVFPPPTDYVKREDIRIEDLFALVKVDKDTLAAEVLKCLPTVDVASGSLRQLAERLPLPGKDLVNFQHASSASSFMIYRDRGTCIRQSEDRYPILAAEALLETVKPEGPSPYVITEWNRKIVGKLAQSGLVRVAYVMGNGNAFLANYWVAEAQPRTTLTYTNAFRKKGQWEDEAVDFRFSSQDMRAVSEVARNGQRKRWNLIQLSVDP